MIEHATREMNVREGELVHPIDDFRGTGGMLGFIATEFALFVILFFSYFYLATSNVYWASQRPPELKLPLLMLVVLLLSSAVLHWGEKRLRKDSGQRTAAQLALAATILIGLVFMGLQTWEYSRRLKELTPQTDAYGSIFYAITSFHALHVILGLLMLGYVLILPRWEPAANPPHRPYHNVALYWHFVDFVWIFIVAALYVLPHLRGSA